MNIQKKIISAALAVSTMLWLSSFALPASAQSIQDLLNQIAALQAQLQALQAGQSAGAGAVCFHVNLKVGSKGTDVTHLQTVLTKDGSYSGPVTGFFGPLTKAGVIKFQQKYAADVLVPVGLTKGTGFVGHSTLAKLNALFCVVPSASPVATPSVSTAPGVSPSPVVSAAPVSGATVSLASDNPAGSSLISTVSIGAQALAPVLAFNLTAGSNAVTVTSVVVHRAGISNDADISNMYLYYGGTQLANSPSVSSGDFTFTNSAGLFTVEANTSKEITVKIDVTNNTTAGKTYTFRLASASSVATLGGRTVSGTFPITGNSFQTAVVTDLGELTLTNVSPTAATNVTAGTTGTTVWQWTAQASNQKISVNYLKLTAVGSAPYDALQNLKLLVNGVQVGSTVATMNSDKTVVFDLSANPWVIHSGVTATVQIQADVVKGSSLTYYLEIQNAGDISAQDLGYGVFVKVNQNDVWSIFKAGGTSTISAGTLTINKDNGSPTGPLAKSTTNIELARYDVKANGENIKISTVVIQLAMSSTIDTVKNLKVTVNGTQIGTTQSTANGDSTEYTFNAGSSFVVPAGVTETLSVWADLTGTVTANDTIAVTWDGDSGNAYGLLQSSGTTIDAPASDFTGNTISVTAGTLSVVKNAALANVSSVTNSQSQEIGSWLITAPTDQGVNVTSLVVNDNGGSVGLGDAFDALVLKSGGTQYGATLSGLSSTEGTTQTFTFSNSLAIAAGQSVEVDLFGNILSAATVADWAGQSTSSISLADVYSTGQVNNSAVNVTTATAGQTVTLASAGTVTVANEVAPTMPSSQYLVTGDTQQTLGAWKFSANKYEDDKINRIKVYEDSSVGAGLPGNFKNLKLWVGGSQVGSTVPAMTVSSTGQTGGYALFLNNSGLFTVPKNNNVDVTLTADINDKTNYTASTTNGDDESFSLGLLPGAATSSSDVSGTGATSGAYVTLAGATSTTASLGLVSNTMTVVQTKPTFALVSPSSTTLIPAADQEVFRFNITAHADDDVVFTSGTHNIRFTMSGSPNTATAYNFKLYDVSAGNAQIGQTLLSTGTSSGGLINFIGQNITVPAGTTKQYYVYANLSNFGTTGNSFGLTINNAAADMSFKDNVASQVINKANYVNVGLPLYGKTLVKP